MKIKQDSMEYRPITIVLETKEEAQGMIEIVDHAPIAGLTPTASLLSSKISNAFTNRVVEIPE